MYIELVSHYFKTCCACLPYNKVFFPQHNLTFHVYPQHNLTLKFVHSISLYKNIIKIQFIRILYRVLVTGPAVNPAMPKNPRQHRQRARTAYLHSPPSHTPFLLCCCCGLISAKWAQRAHTHLDLIRRIHHLEILRTLLVSSLSFFPIVFFFVSVNNSCCYFFGALKWESSLLNT